MIRRKWLLGKSPENTPFIAPVGYVVSPMISTLFDFGVALALGWMACRGLSNTKYVGASEILGNDSML